jgi:hypothetical protein
MPPGSEQRCPRSRPGRACIRPDATDLTVTLFTVDAKGGYDRLRHKIWIDVGESHHAI